MQEDLQQLGEDMRQLQEDYDDLSRENDELRRAAAAHAIQPMAQQHYDASQMGIMLDVASSAVCQVRQAAGSTSLPDESIG